MTDFTIGEVFKGYKLTTVEQQLLAGALKHGHSLKGLPLPDKRRSDSTGFKCNHYDISFLPQLRVLQDEARRYLAKNDRSFFYYDEKQELTNKYFLNPLDCHCDLF